MPESNKPLIVKCPNCGRPVPWIAEQKFKPFCCERCKLIDLGEWAMEEKKIPGEPILPDYENEVDDFFQ